MRVIFMTGKGGVGKSTLAAAAAWQLSQKQRVLVVSLDPAHNLGDVFGIKLNERRHRVSASLFLQEIDLQKIAREYLQKEVNVLTSTYKYLQTLNLENYFSILKYSPGIEEYALLTSIEQVIHQEKTFDTIMFDTPPTGLTLRFLALPRVTMTWIERLRRIREQILEKRYTICRLRGALDTAETVLKYDPDEDEILRRLKNLQENYRTLTATLQRKETSFVLVFNPDVLSLRESERLIEGLKDLQLPLRLLVDNKVTEQNREIADSVEEAMRSLVPQVPLMRISLARTILESKGQKLYDIHEDLASKL
jgi:arsenite-transporting ATPase